MDTKIKLKRTARNFVDSMVSGILNALLNALRKSFPMARITHTYASTEAGLGISVSDGLAGFPVRFLESSKGSVDLKYSQIAADYFKTNHTIIEISPEEFLKYFETKKPDYPNTFDLYSFIKCVDSFLNETQKESEKLVHTTVEKDKREKNGSI